MTLEEFLAWETVQVERHEFVQGEVFAMVGARRVHGRVVMNLGRLLGNALLGSPCSVYADDEGVGGRRHPVPRSLRHL